ncbi:MAG TPA: hypothetical protein PKU91_00670 [Phycisphaerales bacterium]|nr:hypothetical protein [Phycisphaerales bacterium]
MTRRVRSRMNTTISVIALTTSLAVLAGCGATYKPGGDGFSRDAFTYFSTSHRPVTVQLKDTRTTEVLWTYEIPADRELVVRFYPGRNSDNPDYPDEMRWEEWEIGRQSGALENKMPVPNERYRRMDYFNRRPEPAATRTSVR